MLIYAVNAVLVMVDSEKIFGEKSLMQFVDGYLEYDPENNVWNEVKNG